MRKWSREYFGGFGIIAFLFACSLFLHPSGIQAQAVSGALPVPQAGQTNASGKGLPTTQPMITKPVAIAVAEEVYGGVKAKALSGKKRTILNQAALYSGDEVTTGYDGYLKLRMLDNTTFTVGPRAKLILDEFIYDPNTGNGKIKTTIAKGVFRFVTGTIVKKKPENMVVAMQLGSIGIRGTTVLGEVALKREFVMLEKTEGENKKSGHIVVSNIVNGKRMETHITNFGDSSIVEKGKAPTPAAPASEKDRARVQQKLQPNSQATSPGASFGDTVGVTSFNTGPDTQSIQTFADPSDDQGKVDDFNDDSSSSSSSSSFNF